MGASIARLTLIWADGGFDGPAFMMWVMDTCRWIVENTQPQCRHHHQTEFGALNWD
jgi:hypothetical protein